MIECPMPYNNNGGEAVLRGALAGAMLLSRAVGVAPIGLRTRRGKTYARLSRTHALYGCILITIIGCGTIIKIFSWKYDDICRVSLATVLASVLNEIKVVFTMIIVMFGTYSSLHRMKRVLHYLRLIEQVKLRVYYGKSEEVNNKMGIAVASLLLILLLGLITRRIIARFHMDCGPKQVDIALNIVYSMGHLIFMVIEFQIVFLMYAVQGAVRAINEELARMLQHLRQTSLMCKYTGNKQNYVMEEVSRSFVSVCRVVRDFNRAEGALILLQLVCIIAHIVFINYYLSDPTDGAEDNKKNNLIVYLVYHSMEMMFLVEPGHQISEEMYRTRVLLCRLHNERVLTGAPPVLSKLLILHKTVFSPLNMLPFDRPLTISIISFISTSVATILQYRLFKN